MQLQRRQACKNYKSIKDFKGTSFFTASFFYVINEVNQKAAKLHMDSRKLYIILLNCYKLQTAALAMQAVRQIANIRFG